MNNHQKHRRFWFFWILALGLQLPFLLALLGINLSSFNQFFIWYYLMYLASLALLFFALPKGPGWLHRERMWAAPTNVLIIFLPMVGCILTGILYLVMDGRHYEKSLDGTTVLGNLDQLIPEPTNLSKDELLTSIDVLNLAEILGGEDELLIRSAIEKLAMLKSPEALALIMEGRHHPNPEVRFYATSQLAKVKKEFEEDLAAATLSFHQDAGDDEKRLNLSSVYLHYAASNLLSHELTQNMLDKAKYHLEILIKQGRLQNEAYELLFRLLLTQQDYPTLKNLSGVLEHQPDLSRHLQTNLAEYFFACKDYVKLKAILARMAKNFSQNEPEFKSIAPVLQWWGAV